MRTPTSARTSGRLERRRLAVITREHERSGLDTVVDGEMRREEMVEYFAHRIPGYEFNGPVKVWGHNYFDKPCVADEVEYGEPWLVDEFEFTTRSPNARQGADHGPYTLASWSFNERTTARRSWPTSWPTSSTRRSSAGRGGRSIHPDRRAGAGHDAGRPRHRRRVSRTHRRGLPDDVRSASTSVTATTRASTPNSTTIPSTSSTWSSATAATSRLTCSPTTSSRRTVATACGRPHRRGRAVAEIKENIKQGLKVVPPEKLTVSPDCGVKLLPREVAYQKMENMVKAAREVEAELDAGEIDLDAPVPQAADD